MPHNNFFYNFKDNYFNNVYGMNLRSAEDE